MVKINIFGDYVPQHRGAIAIKKGNAISAEILDDIHYSDYNIVNLESPVLTTSLAVQPIFKNGPNLSCSKDALKYLKDCGFQMVTLANNHFYDYGETGVEETLTACNQYGIETIGGGKNIEEASKARIIEKNGIRLGLINICEHEFSIADNIHGGSNPMDSVENFYQIHNLRPKVDKLLLIIHCGTEQYSLPSPRTKKLCHYYVDLGVDAIVCHHAHRYSGFEVYNNAPIFYGLGNFYFDIENKKYNGWNEGYYVTLQFDNENSSFSLHPYTQCFEKPIVKEMDDVKQTKFYKKIDTLNSIISDDEKLEQNFQKWATDHYRFYLSQTFTTAGRFIKGLYRHQLLPQIATRKQEVQLYNLIICESHRDLLIRALKHFLNLK